jgi:YVTN family beta-propeller protein
MGFHLRWPGGYGQNYKLLKSIPIGGEGGWDYLAIDANARKLYVTHASKIVIVDLPQEKVVGEIVDTPGVHGFAIAPELGHGFSSNGAESRVSVIDLKTLQTLAKIETGENPDAILFEPTRSEVYAFNGRGKSATVIDAKNNQVLATVPFRQAGVRRSGWAERACLRQHRRQKRSGRDRHEDACRDADVAARAGGGADQHGF